MKSVFAAVLVLLVSLFCGCAFFQKNPVIIEKGAFEVIGGDIYFSFPKKELWGIKKIAVDEKEYSVAKIDGEVGPFFELQDNTTYFGSIVLKEISKPEGFDDFVVKNPKSSLVIRLPGTYWMERMGRVVYVYTETHSPYVFRKISE